MLAIGLTALVLGGVFIIPKTSFAYRGDSLVKGPNYSVQRHEAMIKAFEKSDYNAWKKLMEGKGRITQVISKDNFFKFAQAHRLMLEGKKDEAAKIRAELGLNNFGNNKGMGRYNK